MRNIDVDDFARARLTPEHQDLLERLRQLMETHAPEGREVISSGSPAWRRTRILAIVSPSKTHLTFAFENGAGFTDPSGLLQGEGKKTRHVKLTRWDSAIEEALVDYIRQAVAADG